MPLSDDDILEDRAEFPMQTYEEAERMKEAVKRRLAALAPDDPTRASLERRLGTVSQKIRRMGGIEWKRETQAILRWREAYVPVPTRESLRRLEARIAAVEADPLRDEAALELELLELALHSDKYRPHDQRAPEELASLLEQLRRRVRSCQVDRDMAGARSVTDEEMYALEFWAEAHPPLPPRRKRDPSE